MTPEYLKLHAEKNRAQEALKAYLNEQFPKGMRVLVKLRYGQLKWTPAAVWGCDWDYDGVVTVEIDNAKPRSRQRFRRISPQDVTPI